MENDYQEKLMSFLSEKDSEELFADVDYMLKDGVHIQGYGNQIKLYNYIKTYESKLTYYYQSLFKVKLVSAGVEHSKYYYLDFTNGSRGNISEKHRHLIKSEFVIIGFLIYKIIFIDREVELNSVSKLQEKIRIDYEDYKPGIYRLLARSKNTTPGNVNDETVDASIQSALNEFKKIGWVAMEKDEFNILPAFDRLISVYEDYIENFDETLKELQ